jgi:hypothetical protein
MIADLVAVIAIIFSGQLMLNHNPTTAATLGH